MQISFLSKPGGLFLKETIEPCLVEISGPALATAVINMALKDFNGNIIEKKDMNFVLDHNGKAAGKGLYPAGRQSGIFLLEVNAKINSINAYDFFRYTIMPAVPENKSQQLFSVHFSRMDNVKEWLTRLHQAGIGSFGNYSSSPKLDFVNMSGEIEKIFSKYSFAIFSYPLLNNENFYNKSVKNIKKENITPDFLTKLEMIVGETVRKQPNAKFWKTLNEPDAGGGRYTPEVAAILAQKIAGYIRKVQPAAVVFTPDLSHMYAHKLGWFEDYIRYGGLKDDLTVAIHIYRARPENPDLEIDYNRFTELLSKYNYKGAIYFTEGLYWPVHVLPMLDNNAHVGCSMDHVKYRAFSYDIGYGEKISAAYNMRTYLLGLKYSDRVKMMVDWNYDMRYHLDWEKTPRCLLLVPNVLGRLIGDSKFIQDIELGKNYRCYLFADASNVIAAAWCYEWETDNGEKKAPFLFIKSRPENLEFFNMDGSSFLPESKNDELALAIGSFPVFIRTGKKNQAGLVHALQNITGVQKQTVNIRGEFQKPGILTMMAINNSSEIQNGLFSVQPGTGEELKKTCAIASHQRCELEIPVRLSINTFYSNLELNILFAGKSPQKIFFRLPVVGIPRTDKKIIINGLTDEFTESDLNLLPRQFREFAIPKNTASADKNIVSYHGEKDLSARYLYRWNQDGLYFAIEVSDDTHFVIPDAGKIYNGDSIQIFFDSFDNAKWEENTGSFDNNDYAYTVCPELSAPRIFREVCPDYQISFLKPGEEKNIPLAVMRSHGKTTYEIFFPVKYIAPVSLQPGKSFGFAIIINDNDNDYRKRGLCSVPAGTEPWSHPELWTSAVFLQ
ncbi:MAG TPA: hypothetical protein DC049_13355 [Spirochaetia bacterium]|nr:hypothetical protein [Spirochaetia bacterium]